MSSRYSDSSVVTNAVLLLPLCNYGPCAATTTIRNAGTSILLRDTTFIAAPICIVLWTAMSVLLPT